MFKYEEIRDFTIDALNERKNWFTGYGCDLHNEIFNTDYYIIGTYQAKEWLADYTFDAIADINEYEMN